MRGPIPDFPQNRPTVTQVIPLIEAYYRKPGNSVGGNLHVVLDDTNLDNGCIESCLQCAVDRNDADGATLAAMLLQMTQTQRRVAIRKANTRVAY
jgi:hypothetical protein